MELMLNWSEPIRRRVDAGNLCLVVSTGAVADQR
jgi:hypothetical protein